MPDGYRTSHIQVLYRESIPIKMDVCVCVFGHNSGTAGAISTKLGTHIAICMC
jgi:hypothetical protein